MCTVLYNTVYDRLRPYTESVTIDLGCSQLVDAQKLIDSIRKMILDIQRRFESKSGTTSNEVSTEECEPLNIDLDVVQRTSTD